MYPFSNFDYTVVNGKRKEIRMKFKTHNDRVVIETNGSHLQGEITESYDKLVATFGEPVTEGLDKCDAMWDIEFEDGTVATIHNWKDGYNYCGVNGKPVEVITDWSVGGFRINAVINVEKALGK